MRDEAMQALIERVEHATGPDRELDRLIALTAFPPKRRGMYVRRHFTGSLDAAVSLVPSGWEWQVSSATGFGGPIAGLFQTKGKHRTQPQWCREAATPALALVAAALRARMAMEAGDA